MPTATLEGIVAKIKRADEQLRTLSNSIGQFLNDSYKIEGRFDKEARKYRFIACGEPLLPPTFAILVGEITHHLRSTLDHAVTQLHSIGPEDGKLDRLEFPICLTQKAFNNVKNLKVKGLPAEAVQRIEAWQPYNTNKDKPEDEVLWVLHDLDRIDKHRLLLVVATCVQMADTLKINGKIDVEITGMTPPVALGIQPTKEGREIFTVDFGSKIDPDIVIDGNFRCEVTFGQPGVIQYLPVIPTLNQVRDVVVKVLKDLFPNQI